VTDHGELVEIPSYADGAFAGVAIFDSLFVTDREIVVIGNLHGLWTIETVRVSVNANGDDVRRRSGDQCRLVTAMIASMISGHTLLDR
jgi:hypothetical protein